MCVFACLFLIVSRQRRICVSKLILQWGKISSAEKKSAVMGEKFCYRAGDNHSDVEECKTRCEIRSAAAAAVNGKGFLLCIEGEDRRGLHIVLQRNQIYVGNPGRRASKRLIVSGPQYLVETMILQSGCIRQKTHLCSFLFCVQFLPFSTKIHFAIAWHHICSKVPDRNIL